MGYLMTFAIDDGILYGKSSGTAMSCDHCFLCDDY